MEALISLFIFPAAAGYIVLTRSSIYRVRVHGYTNPRLFIESVLFGLALLYLSYTFISLIKWNIWFPSLSNTFYENLMGTWNLIMWPLKNEIAAEGHPTNESVFAILIALSYVGLDVFLDSRGTLRLWEFVLDERDAYLGPVERMCALSMNEQVPVQITLKNRKVYVGLVLDLPHISPSNKMQKFLNIMPIQSYARDSETLSASKKVTDYTVLFELMVLARSQPNDPLHGEISKKAQNLIHQIDPVILENIDTGIVIDMDEIVSISLWDRAVAEAFRSKK